MKEMLTYLTFDGNCREAMEFYAKCLDAKLVTHTFGEMPANDAPECQVGEEAKNRLMHARITKGSATLMASDTMPGMPFTPGNNFSITINCDNAEEADRYHAALSEGGQVMMPPGETFWADRFGMLKDKYGIDWMVNYTGSKEM